jgi:DNA ligase (NAD+)
MDNNLQLMKEKVKILQEAAKAYFLENREILSNLDYDRLYDEVLALEAVTGIVLSNSPTAQVGYELAGELPKEAHEKPMLSLDKTKDPVALKEWLGDETGVLSWKLDGITLVLTYTGGKLTKAVTRGNGTVGEVVTANARAFANVPLSIQFKGDLIIRGEAIIRYSDFEKINSGIEDLAAKYKNPRNLVSGSVRQLSSKVTAERSVRFMAFSLVMADGMSFDNSKARQMSWLEELGFDVVDYKQVDKDSLDEAMTWFAGEITRNDFPSDGLVLTYDNLAYGDSLGRTAKFFKDAIAFKWRDEIRETTLLKIEWSASRTGLINPIAVFEPVELEGTTVSRASVHNISIMEELALGIGDTIGVYKANMIIPQISENLTRSGGVPIPETCPVCSGRTEVSQENQVKVLYCRNADCLAKHIQSLTHFVSKNAIGIDGLSEATIEKLVDKGLIKEPSDLFKLQQFKEEITEMEGFGEKSFANLVESADNARNTSTPRLLYSLGIPTIGLTNAKTICRHFGYDWARIAKATLEELQEINGVGGVMAEAYVQYFADPKNQEMVQDILAEIRFEEVKDSREAPIFEGLTFVITGSLETYENRDALKNIIEARGGKVTDAVTARTHYLINNDSLSSSAKNKKAKELGIKIITEGDVAVWIQKGADHSGDKDEA